MAHGGHVRGGGRSREGARGVRGPGALGPRARAATAGAPLRSARQRMVGRTARVGCQGAPGAEGPGAGGAERSLGLSLPGNGKTDRGPVMDDLLARRGVDLAAYEDVGRVAVRKPGRELRFGLAREAQDASGRSWGLSGDPRARPRGLRGLDTGTATTRMPWSVCGGVHLTPGGDVVLSASPGHLRRGDRRFHKRSDHGSLHASDSERLHARGRVFGKRRLRRAAQHHRRGPGPAGPLRRWAPRRWSGDARGGAEDLVSLAATAPQWCAGGERGDCGPLPEGLRVRHMAVHGGPGLSPGGVPPGASLPVRSGRRDLQAPGRALRSGAHLDRARHGPRRHPWAPVPTGPSAPAARVGMGVGAIVGFLTFFALVWLTGIYPRARFAGLAVRLSATRVRQRRASIATRCSPEDPLRPTPEPRLFVGAAVALWPPVLPCSSRTSPWASVVEGWSRPWLAASPVGSRGGVLSRAGGDDMIPSQARSADRKRAPTVARYNLLDVTERLPGSLAPSYLVRRLHLQGRWGRGALRRQGEEHPEPGGQLLHPLRRRTPEGGGAQGGG